MNQIPKTFNIKDLKAINNLYVVLGHIRDNPFRLRKPIIAGEISSTIWKYIRELQKANGLRAQSKLTTETIDMINRLAFGDAIVSNNYNANLIKEVQILLIALGYDIDSLEQEKMIYGDTTRQSVQRFQEQSGIESSGELDDVTLQLLKVNVSGSSSNNNGTTTESYQVKGAIPSVHWDGGYIEVYSKKFRTKEVLVATQREFQNGYYKLNYNVPAVEKKEDSSTPSIHLLVKLLDKEGTVVESKTFFNAPPVTIANFTNLKTVENAPTSISQKIKKIQSCLGDLPISKIEQTVENPDISFLIAEVGLKEHELIELVVAHKLAEDLVAYDLITPDIINAFLEQHALQNLPYYLEMSRRSSWTQWMDGYLIHRVKEGIFLLSVKEQETILEKALKENILPPQTALVLEKTKEQLVKARKEYILNTTRNPDRATLQNFIDWAKLDKKHEDSIIDIFVKNGGFNKEFTKTLTATEGLSSKNKQAINSIANLGEMVQYNLPMMKLLQQQIKARSTEKASYLEVKSPRDLAKWEITDWETLLTRNFKNIPKTIHIEDKVEKIKFYAHQLQEKVEQLFPDIAFAAKLYRSDKHKLKNINEVADFIDNRADFNLKSTIIDVFVKEHKEALSVDAVAELKVLKRIHNISASAQVGQTLIEQEIYSAMQVYEMGANNLKKMLGHKGISSLLSAQTYTKVTNIYGTAVSMAGTYSFNQLNPKAIIQLTHTDDTDGTPSGLTNGLPDLENLFGSVDYCQCKHCRSVYSPAAYLADLLRFLSQKTATGGENAKDVLLERRPDIDDIGLNCENAHQPLPYIDLVCEVLENRLKHGSSSDNINFAHDTTWSQQDLKAMPEYEREIAYEILIKKPTLHQHFNLWQTKTDLFLNKLGLPYHQLMSTWRPVQASTLDDIASIAAAYFGLSTGAKDFIFNKNPLLTEVTIDSLWQHELLNYSGVSTVTKSVEEFLKTTRLSYDQLIELLQLDFINPEGETIIERPIGTCAISAQKLKNKLTVGFFSKVSRFLRLWRATDWEMWELDLLLKTRKIGNRQLDAHSLVNLQKFHQLQKQLKLSVEELMVFYEDMNVTARRDTNNNPINPLYERLFLHPTIDADLAVFATDIVTKSNSIDTSHAATIAAVMQIDENNIVPLLPTNITGYSTGLEHLSWVYRKVLLSQALGLSIAELDLLSRFAMTNPFAHPSSTQQLLDYKKWLDESGLDLVTIEYLLTNNPSELQLEEASITEYLKKQRTALRELKDGLQDSTKTSKDIIKAYLGQIAPFSTDENILQDALNLIYEEGRWAANYTGTTNNSYAFISDNFDFVKDKSIAINTLEPQSSFTTTNKVDYVLSEIEYYLNQVIVRSITSENLQLNEDIIKAIWELKPDGNISIETVLRDNLLLNGNTINPSNYRDMYKAYYRLDKMALLIRSLNLDLPVLELFIAQYPNNTVDILHLTDLPIDSTVPSYLFVKLMKWSRWIKFNKTYSSNNNVSTLNDIWTSPDLTTLATLLSNWTKWDHTIVEPLLVGGDSLGFSLAHFNSISTLETIQDAINQQQLLGAKVAMFKQWANRTWDNGLPSTNNNVVLHQKQIAQQIQQVYKSKHSDEQWLVILVELQDQLRIQKRDALLSCLLETDFNSTNEIYQYLLIDVEMSACQMTSRIKEAISSIQLFVQRAFMNLENEVKIPKTDADELDNWGQWKWMQNYRVWEANRKVFLYPENWIEPELRDDKTPFFKDLEEELLQTDITKESVEAAFSNYLDKLHVIDNLEIMSISHKAAGGYSSILARTPEIPHKYYFRRYNDYYNNWTAWEEVTTDIKGNHPVSQTINEKHYIFWLEILEKPTKLNKVPGLSSATSPTDAPETPPYKEIQLAWSSKTKDGWTAKTISKKKIIHPWPRPEYSLHLKVALRDNEGFWLDIFVSTSPEFNDKKFYNQYSGEFEKMTPTTHDETKAPWHSAGFLFDKDRVKRVKVYGADDSSTNLKPLKIEGAQQTFNASTWTIGSLCCIYSIDTNYGTYEIEGYASSAIGSGGMEWNGLDVLNQKIEATSYNTPPAVISYLLDSGLFQGAPLKIGLTDGQYFAASVGYSLQQLNNFIATGNINTQHGSNFSALFTNSNTDEYYAFVHNNFGEDGRYTERLTDSEKENDAFMPFQMHYQYNQLVKHTSEDTLPYLALPREGVPRVLLILGEFATEKSYYKVNIPMMTSPFNSWGLSSYIHSSNATFEDKDRTFFLRYDNERKKYIFYPLYHPYTREFITKLKTKGLEGLLSRKMQLQPVTTPKDISDYYTFNGSTAALANTSYQKEIVDFQSFGSYATYNWEIFFHIPLLIATQLSKNQRFEEAMRWFHFIFNPTDTAVALDHSIIPSPQKYWITKEFYEHNDLDYQNQQINNILNNINDYDEEVAEWKNNPFQPHLVARKRPVAYQRAVVMKYIDNLVAWGDQLYRRETLEAINQARLLYVIAHELLGERPQEIAATPVTSKTYQELESSGTSIDIFGNTEVLVAAEGLISTSAATLPTGEIPIFKTKYFCIPHNEKLIGYWDLVEDRLFKIRHCMNIDGVVRQLPLFASPIDPALLVKATANGLDLGTILDDMAAPRSNYKYRVLARTASQFCSEVKSLGQSLLSALQSKDSEGMALLQSSNAIKILETTTQLKELQIDETKETLASLENSKQSATTRKKFYESREYINKEEGTSIKLNKDAISYYSVLEGLDSVAQAIALIPDFKIGIQGMASSPVADFTWGSSNIVRYLQAHSSKLQKKVSRFSQMAGVSNTMGAYKRRQEEWDLQVELADKELEQIDKQIIAAQIRLAIAEKGLNTHELQIENTKTEGEYLKSKYSNQQLYSWMVSQISTVYFQAYQLAYDMAKRAEKSFKYELAVPTSSSDYIKFGYWDSLKKGLLSGDKLMLDINKMEAAYLEQNKREFELTKNISLRQLAPVQLLTLITTGECLIDIPEWWFDMDFSGHYMRRIKGMSLSIPCIVGPYTNVNCTLTLEKHGVRSSPIVGGTYNATTPDVYSSESVAISQGQNDSGLFEFNFNDERYLPFEGVGAISSWKLKLAETDLAQFDYTSITDVVLHMRYTARNGGETLKQDAISNLKYHINTQIANLENPAIVFSLKQYFATAWHRFIHPDITTDPHQLSFKLEEKHFPYFTKFGNGREIIGGSLLIITKNQSPRTYDFDLEITDAPITITSNSTSTSYTTLDNQIKELAVNSSNLDDQWRLEITSTHIQKEFEDIDDIILVFNYKVELPS